MNRARIDPRDYTLQLRQALRQYLPASGLPLLSAAGRWSDRILVTTMLLLVFSSLGSLQDRFAEARAAVVQMYPSRRRPGQTYTGFMGQLRAHSTRLLAVVTAALRQRLRDRAGTSWKIGRHLAFGVDGTKSDAPRTQANQDGLKIGGKKKSGPQQLLVTLLHLGTGLPWSWRRGEAIASERALLLEQLAGLPPGALLVADAGFIGYDWGRRVLAAGYGLLVRAGNNVRLIQGCGTVVRQKGGLVYLWPEAVQKEGGEPLVLRRIVLVDGRNRQMCLLTSLTAAELTVAEARELYRRRWGIEVFFRGLKQTLARRKMLSDAPVQAGVELDWTMAGYGLLGLMLWEHRPKKVAVTQGLAWALRLVRAAVAGRGDRRGSFATGWRHLSGDRYQRTGSKTAYNWPHKKKEPPCGMPKLRMATAAEIRSAHALARRKQAA
jgi:hypothetical protein